MQSKLKDINTYTKEITIDVPWKDLEENFISTFKDFKKGYSIPGFRKGRVPDNIVKKNYGPAIEADFTEKSINKYYQLALQELKLFPINKAEINNLEFKEGANLKYTAKFEITPEFKLPDYKKKLKIDAVRVEQTDNDLNEALLNLQKKHATVKPVKDGAKVGHFIQGDFQELDESDLPIIGKKYDKQYICYGEGVFSGEGALPLEGIKKDESTKVNIDYGEGKKIRYEISVNRVDEQILPELNDDFAKIADPNIKTLDKLKAKLKDSIQGSLDKEFSNQIDQNISRYLVDKTKLDVPDSMRENYINNVMEELKQKNKNDKPLDKDEVTKMYKDIADWNIAWYLIRGRLIRENDFKVNDTEIKEKIDIASKNSNLPIDQVKKFYEQHENRHKIEDDIINEKLFNHLKEFTIIKEKSKTTDQLRKEKEKNG